MIIVRPLLLAAALVLIPSVGGTAAIEGKTISTQLTRPADSTPYSANDAFADATAVVGGSTIANACVVAGGYGVINDAIVTASGSTAYQGEIWLFDQAVTAINDNAAFTITDAEAKTLVGVIPFNTNDTTALNAVSYVTGINVGFTCVGTTNLRFLVKIMNAPTPASAEVLTVRLKVVN